MPDNIAERGRHGILILGDGILVLGAFSSSFLLYYFLAGVEGIVSD